MPANSSDANAPRHEPSVREIPPDPLRHVRLESGHTLRTWDTGRTRGTGMMARTRIGYEFSDPAGEVLFRGDDFGPSPRHADDSDATLRALLGFLTLRPGDTDADYLAHYTDRQRAFAASDACELLAFVYSDQVVGTDNACTFEEIDGEGSEA